jgi:esterase/lipase superfamily enzyme
MPKYWMITNRNVAGTALGGNRAAKVTYWLSDGAGPLDTLASWGGRPVSQAEFKKQVLAAAQAFPVLPASAHEGQKHVTLFVHGYNNSWADAVNRYRQVSQSLFEGDGGLGICILFTWPSKGSPAEYLADRGEAVQSAADLAGVLSDLYDFLSAIAVKAVAQPADACRAKTSMIAHSMGNYVLQKAAQVAWTRKNQPLLMSLLNQLVMVAADVDNDLFKSGETVDKSDGDALANLTYRITALYSGLDQVLGLSTGLKHFGKRRLGRSGLDRTVREPDNVWDIDCTPFFQADQVAGFDVHGAYFDEPQTIDLLRQVLRGVDRSVLTVSKQLLSSAPVQAVATTPRRS